MACTAAWGACDGEVRAREPLAWPWVWVSVWEWYPLVALVVLLLLRRSTVRLWSWLGLWPLTGLRLGLWEPREWTEGESRWREVESREEEAFEVSAGEPGGGGGAIGQPSGGCTLYLHEKGA